MTRGLLVFLVLSAALYAAETQSGHIDSADQECRQCHLACFPAGLNGHPGTDNNGCVYCHNSTVVGNDIFNVSRPGNSDCIDCHNSSVTYRINEAHEAFPCVACHSPHGSDQQYLLRKGTNALCTEQCHTAFQLGRSHPRGPGIRDFNTGNEITCTSSCHQIHTACTDKLLADSTPVLCAKCHPDKL